MPKSIDLSGQRFGKWLAIKKLRGGRPRGSIWLCQCACGNTGEVPTNSLRSGKSTNCGCGRIQDISGQTFGYWTALARAPNGARGEPLYLCVCKCGTQKIVQPGSLKNGATTSCGCRYRKHGKSKTREHNIWIGMIRRCHNKNDQAYFKYGARGISVCERWRSSFSDFYADMGKAPAGTEIERVDNNGNYCPENCRWATPQDQANNRRSNRLITFNGKTQTLMQWARETGIKRSTIQMRLDSCKWPVERALTLRRT